VVLTKPTKRSRIITYYGKRVNFVLIFGEKHKAEIFYLGFF